MVGPKPPGGQAVHDGVDEREEAVRVEVAPLGDPPRHDRGRRRREGQLQLADGNQIFCTATSVSPMCV